jgi:hypothetical protein
MVLGDLSKSYEFAWPIPAGAPASGAGKITEIRWVVKVTVDRSMAKDTNEEHEITVRRTSGSAPVEAEEDVGSSHVARMQLTLPSLELAAGSTAKGQLTIEPFQSIKGRALRVDLVRDETVFSGDRTNHEETRITTVEIESDPRLEPGQSRRYDMALEVPADAVPTRKTPHGELRWQVKAVIDRPMASDHVATQEVSVYNARPAASG